MPRNKVHVCPMKVGYAARDPIDGPHSIRIGEHIVRLPWAASPFGESLVAVETKALD